MNMKKIEPELIKDNFIEIIGKEWMLISAGDKNKFNTMTANWGGAGYLWNKPVVFVFVRPERYTHHFIEEKGSFTISFLGEENKKIHAVCGSKTGREIDKIAETGLIPVFTPNGNPTFEQSRLTLDCKILYSTKMEKSKFLDPALSEQWYNSTKGNFHTVYVAEITDAWEKEV